MMIRIIPEYDMSETMEFEAAVRILENRTGGDLLKALEQMQAEYTRHLKGECRHDGDEYEWCHEWQFEANAYNCVVEKMMPLFEEMVQ